MQILIVDESRTSQAIFRKILEGAGFDSLVFVESVPLAYEYLDIDSDRMPADFIDLILMDLDLPGINGIEACKRIKSTPGLRDTPVIMITTLSEIKNLEKAFLVGAHDYITKSVNEIDLIVRVRAAIALKKEIEKRRNQALELEKMRCKLEESNKKLETLVTTDKLTKLANRRSFDHFLSLMWNMALREKMPLSLLLMNIDHFKKYNDTYGEVEGEGDECLRKVASTLSSLVKRSTDLVARYGVEEFAAILPNTISRGAAYKAQTLVTGLSGHLIPHGAPGAGDYVTISIGVATLVPRKEENREDLILMADSALSRAKENGRNGLFSLSRLVEEESYLKGSV